MSCLWRVDLTLDQIVFKGSQRIMKLSFGKQLFLYLISSFLYLFLILPPLIVKKLVVIIMKKKEKLAYHCQTSMTPKQGENY